MQRYLPILIILILLAALAGIGVWYARANPEAVDQVLAELELKEPQIEGIGGSGFVEAVQVDIACELGGQIAAVRVDEGDEVQPGDVLIELDSVALAAQIRQAEAAVEAAEARLARVKAGARPEEIRQAEAAVAQAEAARDGAEQAWKDAAMARDNPQQIELQIDAAETELAVSWQQLREALATLKAAEEGKKQAENTLSAFPAGADEEQLSEARTQYKLAMDAWWQTLTAVNMAQAQLEGARVHVANLRAIRDNPLQLIAQIDAARTQYDVARAAVDGAQAQLALANAGARDFEIRLAEAGVRQAEAQLRTLQIQLDKMTLRSPMDATVIERVAHEGETVAPGATLLRLGQLSPVTLTIYVPETDLGRLQIGQPAEVRVDAFPGKVFEGEIVLIASEAEFTPKNVQTKEERANLVFAVKIRLPNSEGLLKPGMPADAVIEEEIGD
ncbi:MAG: HlyD family secretion protein [Anaerolineae bacterium]